MQHPRSSRTHRGFSAVEVVISAAILLTVYATIARGFASSGGASQFVGANLQVALTGTVRRIAAELERGELDAQAADGASLAYQFPVDPDGDGSFFDATGAVQWGMEVGGADVAGARATVAFVTDQVLDEAALGADVNGDGDQVDRFDRGHLVRSLPDGSSVSLTGAWILQPTGAHGGDVTGDLVPDPIFSTNTANPRKLASIDVTGAVVGLGNQWIRVRLTRTVCARNDT